MEWSGVEWSGVEWSGVEWSGVEWSGVVCDMIMYTYMSRFVHCCRILSLQCL